MKQFFYNSLFRTMYCIFNKTLGKVQSN